MKKEVFVAIFIGLILGLVVTYGIYVAQRTRFQNNFAKPSPTPTVEQSNSRNSLILLTPVDELIQPNKDLSITGTTEPNATLIIFVNNVPTVEKADSSGNFASLTNLEAGPNTIIVQAIDEDGNVVEETRTVIVSSATLNETPTATTSASPKPSTSPKPTATPKPKTATTSGTAR